MTEVIMKNLLRSIIAIISVLCISLGVISCSKIKGKSKVEEVTVTISVNGTMHEFKFDLYLNYAGGTIEHFKHLATSNYYTNSAVSNVNGHVEFGAYKFADNGAFRSKDTDYTSLITPTYMADKYLYYGKDKNEMKDYPRYRGGCIVGEFASNGYTGSDLNFDGALVLKRDVDTEISANAYNTGKATMAVTFGTGDYYFTSPSEFAIIGMISKEDGDATTSSYARLKKIMTDYAEDSNGNVYYYYTLGTAEYYESLNEEHEDVEIAGYGHYFMYDKEESCYRWDSNGDGKVNNDDEKLEDDTEVEGDAAEIIIKELAENGVYLNTIPYEGVVIKVEKITFAK